MPSEITKPMNVLHNNFSLGQPVTSKRFKHQMVHGNFKGLAVSKTVSLTQCSAYCLTVTEDHHCTTFKREDSDKVCHCGILSPFVIEHENQEQMYVRSNCKASNISGDKRLHIIKKRSHDSQFQSIIKKLVSFFS